MLATFAFDVCHDVYRAAREVIDTRIPTLNMESSGKYLWRPDRLPRLAEYVADFARAGERVLGEKRCGVDATCAVRGERAVRTGENIFQRHGGNCGSECVGHRARSSRLALFHVYFLGGAEYAAARRHLGISEITWSDWSEEIRAGVGRELMRSGVFPPAKYFREFMSTAA